MAELAKASRLGEIEPIKALDGFITSLIRGGCKDCRKKDKMERWILEKTNDRELLDYITETQNKLHRRNMQIKELKSVILGYKLFEEATKKDILNALSWLQADAFGKVKISNAIEILSKYNR